MTDRLPHTPHGYDTGSCIAHTIEATDDEPTYTSDSEIARDWCVSATRDWRGPTWRRHEEGEADGN